MIRTTQLSAIARAGPETDQARAEQRLSAPTSVATPPTTDRWAEYRTLVRNWWFEVVVLNVNR